MSERFVGRVSGLYKALYAHTILTEALARSLTHIPNGTVYDLRVTIMQCEADVCDEMILLGGRTKTFTDCYLQEGILYVWDGKSAYGEMLSFEFLEFSGCHVSIIYSAIPAT